MWGAWWRRFSRILARMTGLFVALAIAVLPAGAQEEKKTKGETIRVRFIDQHEETVEVVDWNERGIRVRMKDVPQPVFFEWYKLDPGHADTLKKRYLGKAETPAEEGVTIEGVRIRTSKETVEGVVLESPPDEIKIKNAADIFVFKVADVVSQEKVRLRVNQVYTGEELEKILLQRMPPVDAEDWDKLGAELLKLGHGDRARQAFNLAEYLRRPELPEGQVYRDLVTLRRKLEDISLQKSIYQVQEVFLAGQYDEALLKVDALERAVRDEALLKDLRRLRTELQQLRDQSREEQIVAEWTRMTEVLIRTKAFDRMLGYRDAVSYVMNDLPADILKAVNERFHITGGDTSAKLVWEQRSARTANKHSYQNGSWLIERAELGAPETWWAAADDASRFRVLKGVAIEKHCIVLRVVEKNCPTCGGTGTVDRAKYPHATLGICPSCLGLKHERTVFYR